MVFAQNRDGSDGRSGVLWGGPSTPGAIERPAAGWFRAGDHPGDYEMAVDPKAGRQGKARSFIKGKRAQPQGFGTLMQSIDAVEYRGKRLGSRPR